MRHGRGTRMAGSLTEALRGRSAPLLIDIDEHGCIVAADHHFNTSFEFGVAFPHPEGEIVVGFDRPTRAQSMGLDTPEFAASTYAEQKRAAMDEQWGSDIDDADCPWVEIDATGGVLPASDTEERLRAWLDEPEDSERVLGWHPRVSQWLPGFEIMDAMGAAERKRHGLREVDIGGPTSGGCWAVQVRASPEKLDAAPTAKGLPFRVRLGSE
jgi:hypothetical protein